MRTAYRTMTRTVLAMVVVLALPAMAVALPGDPPVELLTPDGGATVAPAPHVVFTCPEYRKFDTGAFTSYGNSTDYEVLLATRPVLGGDGRLLDANVVFRDVQPLPDASGPGRCGADLDASASGTFYWQADRVCTGCAGGHETSGVRRLDIRGALTLSLRAPTRGFAGFPVVAALRAGGVPDGGTVSVERRAGRNWKRVASVLVLGGRGTVALVLPRGAQRLRMQAVVGAQAATSPVRAVRVVRPRGWSTSRRDDGRYRGQGVALRVARAGRSLRGFSATVSTFCPGPNTFVTGTAPLKRARIAPDGRFYALAHLGGETVVELSGQVRSRRVTGSVRLSAGGCEGSRAFTARPR